MPLEAVQVTQKIKLTRARAQVRLSQQQLATRGKVSKRVIARAEAGEVISQLSAWGILNALNEERVARGMIPLELEQLEWNVEGE